MAVNFIRKKWSTYDLEKTSDKRKTTLNKELSKLRIEESNHNQRKPTKNSTLTDRKLWVTQKVILVNKIHKISQDLLRVDHALNQLNKIQAVEADAKTLKILSKVAKASSVSLDIHDIKEDIDTTKMSTNEISFVDHEMKESGVMSPSNVDIGDDINKLMAEFDLEDEKEGDELFIDMAPIETYGNTNEPNAMDLELQRLVEKRNKLKAKKHKAKQLLLKEQKDANSVKPSNTG
jgi:hypothetical protein